MTYISLGNICDVLSASGASLLICGVFLFIIICPALLLQEQALPGCWPSKDYQYAAFALRCGCNLCSQNPL